MKDAFITKEIHPSFWNIQSIFSHTLFFAKRSVIGIINKLKIYLTETLFRVFFTKIEHLEDYGRC